MKEIKKVDPVSLAKVWGVLYAIVGLLIGLLFAAFGSIIRELSPDEGGSAIGNLFGTMSLFFFPIFYGVIGLIAGIIGGFLYNWIASLVGGIQIELKD
jgi:hypothetical protein